MGHDTGVYLSVNLACFVLFYFYLMSLSVGEKSGKIFQCKKLHLSVFGGPVM